MGCHTKFPTARADRGRALSSVRATSVAPPGEVDQPSWGLLQVPRDGFCDARIMHLSTARRRAMRWNQRACTGRRFAVRDVDFSPATRGAMISVTRDVVTDLTGGGPKIVQVRRV
jgi:hypothetical protein